MYKQLIFIVALISVLLLCASCVSADDLNSTDFDDLATQINETPEDTTLNLEKDYRLNNKTQKHIVIDKSMTIDGNNHTIDAPDVSRVFWVKADNVVIKNINFVNSKASDLAGGVISWWGDNGTLSNCNFTNNSAVSGGGAVYWSGADGIVSKCNFNSNHAVTGADLSLTCGEGFDPHQMHIMTVNSDGGALCVKGNNISIDCCNFENNYCDFAGGALSVKWADNVRISNSKFKNNKASNGGAIDLNAHNALIYNSSFENNTLNDLFNNCRNISVLHSSDIILESFYDINFADSFESLSKLINDTPENGILTLTNDYQYITGSNKGILINKTITIDGKDHTLNGNHLSRMFNITADNVVIKNINFINGNAYGRYFSKNIGGGAIYWSGANGRVENCNFTNNTGNGVEDDPFDKEESFVDENGTVWHVVRMRPMGTKINEGGAIVWNGTNGTVLRCIFINNNVGYPNSGGAICWRGDFGKVLESTFYRNNAWGGAAISWIGANGTVLYSKFFNIGAIFSRDLMWFGENGTISYSFIVASGDFNQLRVYSENFTADYNFWGDIIGNDPIYKPSDLKNWVVLNMTYDKGFIVKGETVCVNCTVLLYENGLYSNFTFFDIPTSASVKADKSGFIKVSFKDGKIIVDIVPKTKILSENLKKYYRQSKHFKVRVFAADGNPATGKYVKFTINNKTYKVKINKKGYATLKLKLKPGKYKVITEFNGFKVKNKIKVKTTLITKNISKKVKKSAKFKVKVLTSKGKKYSKKLVKIKFKGKIYKIKTNKKGIAKFKLPKTLKVGKHTIKTYCNGLKNINKVIVKNNCNLPFFIISALSKTCVI